MFFISPDFILYGLHIIFEECARIGANSSLFARHALIERAFLLNLPARVKG